MQYTHLETPTQWTVYVVYRSHQVQVGQGGQLSQCTLGLLSTQHKSIDVMYQQVHMEVWACEDRLSF